MNIKKIGVRFIAIVLSLSVCVGVMMATALAADTDTGIAVRVNGQIIEFPDEKPYVDENNRTMMPVRFVVEALGAEAEWLPESYSAQVTKGDTKVLIPINSNTLEVTENGVTRTVTMDTQAIIKNGRTFIPIRFIAEALGAHVDWASYHNVACFYDDVLTAEQIARLQAYDYTLPRLAKTYEWHLSKYGEEETIRYYGTGRDKFDSFANAREHLYHTSSRTGRTYKFVDIDETFLNGGVDNFYQLLVEEAAAQVGYQSKRLSVKFFADTSCIYQPDNMDKIDCTVRGIVAVTLLADNLSETTGSEQAMLYDLGVRTIRPQETVYIDLDVHMNCIDSIEVNNVVPLADQTLDF